MHSIFVSTCGVLFLGTPHNGSSKASLASTGRLIVDALVPSKVCDTEGQLVDALKEGSEVLQNVTDMFVPLMKNFRISFFWEQEKTDFKYTRDYVSSSDGVHLALILRGCRWSKRAPLLLFWTMLIEPGCHTTIAACASLKVGALQAIVSS